MSGEGDWKALLDDLEARHQRATAMGGRDRLARQHGAGKLDARQRIARLFDEGSFTEVGALVGGTPPPGDPEVPADALVAGYGRIDGRPALAGAEDFTVLGGSIGPGAADKRYRLCQLAAQERVPLVMMLEGWLIPRIRIVQHSGRPRSADPSALTMPLARSDMPE